MISHFFYPSQSVTEPSQRNMAREIGERGQITAFDVWGVFHPGGSVWIARLPRRPATSDAAGLGLPGRIHGLPPEALVDCTAERPPRGDLRCSRAKLTSEVSAAREVACGAGSLDGLITLFHRYVSVHEGVCGRPVDQRKTARTLWPCRNGRLLI